MQVVSDRAGEIKKQESFRLEEREMDSDIERDSKEEIVCVCACDLEKKKCWVKECGFVGVSVHCSHSN